MRTKITILSRLAAFLLTLLIGYTNGYSEESSTDSIEIYLNISKDWENKNLELSEKYIRKALHFAQEAENKEKTAICYLKLSNISEKGGNTPLTLSLLLDALQLADELDNNNLRYKIYNNMGIVYANNQDLEKAKEYFLRSYDIAKPMHNDTTLATQHNNLGGIFFTLKEYDLAIEHLMKSIEISKKINDHLQLNNAYGNLADLYDKTGKTKLSNQYYNLLTDNIKYLTEASHKVGAYIFVGHHSYNTRNYLKAITYADSALIIGNKLKYVSLNPESYKLLINSYEKLNLLDSSILYHKKLIRFTDSINQLNLNKANELIDIKYKMRRENKAFQLEQKEREIEKKNAQFKILLLSGGVVLMIILGLIIFLNQKNKTKLSSLLNEQLKAGKENIWKELKDRQNQLEMKDQESITEKEVFNSIINTLEESKNAIKSENHKLINSIIKDLKSGMENKAWEEFEVRFTEINNSFYDNLNIRFPELTPNEKKLCAFLRQGMSSKEITNLTGQSTHSVEVARTRLRKKMGLANTEANLNEFLQKF